ncbi:MAG: hypothetical protein M0003_10500 [Acidithiobacillus sp.]|nr:hypothetical protein [Acidithiobacillus sp.]
MARITLNDLSPAVRDQVMAQHGLAPSKGIASKKVKPKQIGAALSPYADLLGNALDTRFPAQMNGLLHLSMGSMCH